MKGVRPFSFVLLSLYFISPSRNLTHVFTSVEDVLCRRGVCDGQSLIYSRLDLARLDLRIDVADDARLYKFFFTSLKICDIIRSERGD
jgi:hypothetical protein